MFKKRVLECWLPLDVHNRREDRVVSTLPISNKQTKEYVEYFSC